MLEQVSCQELALLRISLSCLAVFDGGQYLWIKAFLRRSQESTVPGGSLSTHHLAAPVRVMGKTRNMTASCDTPGMLNKLTMSKTHSTCSWASFLLFSEKTHVALSVTDIEETLELAEKNKKYFEIEKKELSLDNDHLLEHIICQDVTNTVMHANYHSDNVLPANNNSLEHDNSALEFCINDYKSMEQSFLDENEENLKLQSELDKKNDIIEKATKQRKLQTIRLKKLKKKNSSHNQDALEFKEFFTINELKAQLEAKNVLIEKLKEHIANLKGENVVENVQNVHNSNLVTQEYTDTLKGIVEQDKALKLLDNALDYACKYEKRIQELLVCACALCPSSKYVSETLVAVTPMNRTRKVRIPEEEEAETRAKQKEHTEQDPTDYGSGEMEANPYIGQVVTDTTPDEEHVSPTCPNRVSSIRGLTKRILDWGDMMTYSPTSGHEPDPRIVLIPRPMMNGP
ncbi:hypothetical protein Tco_1314356 [Tanacetum coccineum]